MVEAALGFISRWYQMVPKKIVQTVHIQLNHTKHKNQLNSLSEQKINKKIKLIIESSVETDSNNIAFKSLVEFILI